MMMNLQQELKELRNKLSLSMRETLPSRKFTATVMLAMVHLDMTAEAIKRTRGVNERRELIHEFGRSKSAVEKGILLLQGSIPKTEGVQEEQKECMP